MDDEIDIENIEALFEHYKNSDDWQKRTKIAEAYRDIFNEMCYDFACSKLTDEGTQELMPLVERVELLEGNISWSLRAQVYQIFTEQAEIKEDYASVVRNAESSIETLFKQLKEEDPERQLVYESLAWSYYMLINYLPEDAVINWKKSLHYIQTSILENAEKANWIQYFNLMYSPSKQENISLTNLKHSEIKAFRPWCLALYENNNSYSYVIASQFMRFKEMLSYNNTDDVVFPDAEYFFWLEKSLLDPLSDLTPMQTSGAGHFYRKEGMRLLRIDLLERALEYFEKTYYELLDDSAFHIHYISEVFENMAEIYKKKGFDEQADSYITRALEWNEDKQEYIQDNFSLLLHYSEFLERCYHYQGNIPRPTLYFIQSIVKQAEEAGKGYYSGPYFLQARLALDQKHEHAAVAFLCKTLLLHELCIENTLEEFHKNLIKGSYPYLEKFLESTLSFMKEVATGYYFNPAIKFEDLSFMNDTRVVESWIIRKGEIRKRTK